MQLFFVSHATLISTDARASVNNNAWKKAISHYAFYHICLLALIPTVLLAFPIDDGRLEQDEMGDALKASLQENGMDFDTDQIGDLVAALWEDAGLASKEGTVFI